MRAITYFIQGPGGECPKCTHQRYSGPPQLRPGDNVTCLGTLPDGTPCQKVRTISHALWTVTETIDGKKL
jgi:hypothetical protein